MKTTLTLLFLPALLVLAPVTPVAPADDAPKKAKPNPWRTTGEKPDTPDGKAVVIPFELLKSRHMAINVKINGKGPYRVIFDTGAPTNLVNNKIAKEAGLIDPKKGGGGFALFGAAPTPKTIKTFEVGELKLEGMPTMVMDHPTVAAIASVVGPIEGLIGFPFFARYKMTIDYQKREMTLVPNGFVPGDTMKALMEKLMNAGGGKKQEPAVVAPAAVWGFAVDKDDDDDGDGVKVTEVLTKSPAAVGGLKVGDRLMTLDGRWTDSVGDTFVAANAVKPGKAVTLVVKRAGNEVALTVTPGRGL